MMMPGRARFFSSRRRRWQPTWAAIQRPRTRWNCHHENLVAVGDSPVLVDAETVFGAIVAEKPEELPMAARRLAEASLVKTLMLPAWAEEDGRLFDVSALGSESANDEREPLHWVKWGSDDIDLVPRPPTQAGLCHRPWVNGRVYPARDFLPALESGLIRGYRLLLQHREELLRPDGPLMPLAAQPSRVLLRATRLYYGLLQRLSVPAFLRQGVDRSIELELLSRAFLYHREAPPTWPHFHAERRALERAEIPLFWTCPRRHAVVSQDGTIAGTVVPAPQQIRQRLQELSDEDLQFQLRVLRSSFCTKAEAPAPRPDLPPAPRHVSADALRQWAASLAGELESRVCHDPENGPNWQGLMRLPKHRRQRYLGCLNGYLAEGRIGVALFLAACSRWLGRGAAGELARDIVTRLPRELAEGREASIEPFPVGALDGLASLLLASDRITRWVGGRDAFEETARLVLPWLEDGLLSVGPDLYSGSAGVILVLLGCGQPEMAYRYGLRLLQGDLAGLGPGLLLGLSGVALALLELHRHTGEERFRQAALEAMAREEAALQGGRRPDEELSEDHAGGGLTGVARMRLAAFRTLDCPELLQRALWWARRDCGWDSLMNGMMGNTELLLAAKELAGARRLAARCVKGARRRGFYRLARGQSGEILLPGLLTGTAGIGYQLLRLAQPEELPPALPVGGD